MAGYEDNGSYVVAKIWKNGAPQNLTDGSNPSYANSVFVFGNDVYVAGKEYNGTNYVAKVWKNGVPQILTNGANDASASSVFVNNGDVFVAGNVYLAGNDVNEPKLWKNGVEEPLNINSAYDGAKAKSVYVSGNDVYVAGTATASNGSQSCSFATLWKNGSIVVTSPACPENNSMNSVFVDDGQLDVENNTGPENKIALYPNPVQDILLVEISSGNIQKTSLFSITGQRLKSWEGKTKVNLSQFAPGSYFIKIITNEGYTMVKQIIKK